MAFIIGNLIAKLTQAHKLYLSAVLLCRIIAEYIVLNTDMGKKLEDIA